MGMHIRPFEPRDLDDLIELTLLAFEPVFVSFERILGPKIYPLLYPDWRKTQTEWVEKFSSSEKTQLCVAEMDGKAVGLIAYELYDNQMGEVQFLVVHPEYQNRGIGTELNAYALQKLKEGGAKLVEVGTGGDESHAPARRCYEKAGYTALPLVRYYQAL
jgi:ribosomal protein S18 acetylase RimI-like enzyme